MKGCEHNAERILQHKPSGVNGDGKRVYVHGDKIRLICPHGCPDIFVNLKRVRRK